MKVNIAGMKCEGSDAKLEKLKDKRTVSSEEIMDALVEKRQQPGRVKSGYRDDIEKMKSEIIERLSKLITKDSEEYKNWIKGWCLASPWEANVARVFLDKRKAQVLDQILYEPTIFDFTRIPEWFEMAQRGARAGKYIPDFRIRHYEGTVEYIEVKGRLYPGDLKKLKNFRKFYPEHFRNMRFIVMRNSETHKKLRNWKVDREQFTFYQDLKAEYQHIVRWE